MIAAYERPGGFVAAYTDRTGHWRFALDARGLNIICETKALALSVARYRRKRMKIWR